MTEEQNYAVEADVDVLDTAAADAVDPGALLADPTAPADDAATEKDRPSPRRPAGVPEKFWDPKAGALRSEALLKSYLELERKLGSMVPLPSDEQDVEGHERLRRAMGIPETAEGYMIEAPDDALQADPDVNAKLHQAGFTQRQAQLVYDLAAGYVVPLINDAVAELQATRDAERLAAHFGGEDSWRTFAGQIKTWGHANLPQDVMEVLSSSYDGILAMHQMMQVREPNVLHDPSELDPGVDRGELATKMRDPRYWRDRDPAFVAEVTDRFKRLYSN
jgi:hypothetical protein